MRESILRIGACNFFDTGLELHSGSNRSDRAWKLCQEPVAGILDDAAAVVDHRTVRLTYSTTAARRRREVTRGAVGAF
jgi:hypothetical protein